MRRLRDVDRRRDRRGDKCGDKCGDKASTTMNDDEGISMSDVVKER